MEVMLQLQTSLVGHFKKMKKDILPHNMNIIKNILGKIKGKPSISLKLNSL